MQSEPRFPLPPLQLNLGPFAPAACSNGLDLNRDFPDRFRSPTMEASGGEQPEVAAIMQWSLATGFVASASMHEVGAAPRPCFACCPAWPAAWSRVSPEIQGEFVPIGFAVIGKRLLLG